MQGRGRDVIVLSCNLEGNKEKKGTDSRTRQNCMHSRPIAAHDSHGISMPAGLFIDPASHMHPKNNKMGSQRSPDHVSSPHIAIVPDQVNSKMDLCTYASGMHVALL